MNCPRCQQPLPDTPERFCPNCGAEVSAGPGDTVMGAALPPPPPPYDAPPPPPPPSGGNPWDRRDQVGFVSALVETTQRVLTRPTAFFRSLAPTGGMGSALLYAVVLGYLGAVAEALYNFIAYLMMGSGFGIFGSSPQMERLRPFLEGPGMLIGTLIVGPVIIVFRVFVLAGITHVCLLLLGGARHGFEATLRTVCFAEATSVARIIPFCGGIVAFVYGIVTLTIGLSEVHGISRGKAAAAVLLPFLLCCCCVVIVFGGMGMIMGAASLGNR